MMIQIEYLFVTLSFPFLDILKHSISLKNLAMEQVRLYQMSLYPPRVNLEFLENVNEGFQEKLSSLIDLCTCSLHTVHRAIKTRLESFYHEC